MLSLADNSEPRLLKRFDRIEMINAGQLGHKSDRHFDLPHFSFWQSVFDGFQVLTNCVSDVLKGFLFCLPLRPASGQAGTRNTETFFGPRQDDFVSHG